MWWAPEGMTQPIWEVMGGLSVEALSERNVRLGQAHQAGSLQGWLLPWDGPSRVQGPEHPGFFRVNSWGFIRQTLIVRETHDIPSYCNCGHHFTGCSVFCLVCFLKFLPSSLFPFSLFFFFPVSFVDNRSQPHSYLWMLISVTFQYRLRTAQQPDVLQETWHREAWKLKGEGSTEWKVTTRTELWLCMYLMVLRSCWQTIFIIVFVIYLTLVC